MWHTCLQSRERFDALSCEALVDLLSYDVEIYWWYLSVADSDGVLREQIICLLGSNVRRNSFGRTMMAW